MHHYIDGYTIILISAPLFSAFITKNKHSTADPPISYSEELSTYLYVSG